MYQFDEKINRRNTASMKWEVGERELPMWVADMDFRTAPEILDAMRQKLEHGVFGYSIVPDEWYQAYQNWWEKRHGFFIEKEWLLFATGIIPILSSAVRKLTTPGENVLVQTPVYNVFFNSTINNGRNVLEAPLDYRNGEYSVDFSALEKKLADPQTSLMILCNPHNPIGMIWEKPVLERIGLLCEKHHVIVISDEIHCDLTAPGKEYVPFASVSECCRENSITCISPTKAFNLAGVQTAAAFVPNENLRHRLWRALNTDEVAEPNTFAIPSAVAAFEQGGGWLDELRDYLQENKLVVKKYLEEHIPEISVVSTDVTYLLWLDCSGITSNTSELAHTIREKKGLFLTEGNLFGRGGEKFLRMNIACTRDNLMDGLHRLEQGIRVSLMLQNR